MIIAISTVKDEADIIEATISHLFGEGVDEVVISVAEDCTDDTWELALCAGATVDIQHGPLNQGLEMTRLAKVAASMGADWVLPFDADEFWIDPTGGTVQAVLEAVPEHIGSIHCAVFAHTDWNMRQDEQKMGKVVFRASPEASLAWGSHYVYGVPGDVEHGLLEVRELQYRSWEHFLAKVEKACILHGSGAVPPQHGNHMRELTNMTEGQLQEVFSSYINQPATLNPIPYKGTPL